jgi:hypothetical protein
MACFALHWRSLEIDVDEHGARILRFMAIDAPRRRVSARQGKGRPGVVEAGEFCPGLRGMAGFAPERLSI